MTDLSKMNQVGLKLDETQRTVDDHSDTFDQDDCVNISNTPRTEDDSKTSFDDDENDENDDHDRVINNTVNSYMNSNVAAHENAQPSWPPSNDVIMTKYIDSSYLRTIPEDRSDLHSNDGGSSVGGDISGMVMMRHRKAMSTTSSTAGISSANPDHGTRSKESSDLKSRGLFHVSARSSTKGQTGSMTDGGSSEFYPPNRDSKTKKNEVDGIARDGDISKNKNEELWRKQQEIRRKYWAEFWTRKTIVLVAAGAFLTIGVLVAIVVVAATANRANRSTSDLEPDGKSSAPKPSPTVELAHDLVDTNLQMFVTLFVPPNLTEDYLYRTFNDTYSAQYQARDWILHYDNLLVGVIEEGSKRFYQRYSLIAIYFALNGPFWGVTNTTLGSNDTQLEFLMPDEHECNWTGVYCRSELYYAMEETSLTKNDTDTRRRASTRMKRGKKQREMEQILIQNLGESRRLQTNDNYVVRLWMPQSNLSGSIPFEFAGIETLNELDLSGNNLYGTVPDELCEKLTNLSWLDLSNNQLSGQIPSEMWSFSNLKKMYLNENNFNGTIERRFVRRTNLAKVWIQQNQLTGPLPSWLSDMVSLKVWIAFDNQFNGTIPRQGSMSRSLEYFDVSNNQLSGDIPDWLWSSGAAPQYLSHIYMDHNRFNSTLPESSQSLSLLKKVWLHDNHLSGTIPLGFAENWMNLEELKLHYNENLTGTLGPTNEDECQFKWVNKTDIRADCNSQVVDIAPPVSCICCTKCQRPR